MTPPERKGANSSALPSADPSKTLVFYHLFVEHNDDIPRVSNLSRHQLSHLDPHHHQPWITENWCGEGDIGAASWNTFECKLNGFEADSFRFDLSCFPSFSIIVYFDHWQLRLRQLRPCVFDVVVSPDVARPVELLPTSVSPSQVVVCIHGDGSKPWYLVNLKS